MNIKIEKNGEYIFYIVYGYKSKMCTDKDIAKLFDISVVVYSDRFKKLNIIKFYNGDNEAFLVNYINEDKLIDIFKNEIVKELTLLKLSN